jgi:sensor c-di-GMP phosphodiesterase-like protein
MKDQIYQLWINQIILSNILILLFYGLFLLVKKAITNHYSLQNTLKYALKHKQFYPVYQPIYDQNTQCFAGAEVLLRWSDSNEETILPDFFITEAERSGIIIPITLYIIESAFTETLPLFKTVNSFYLSINISALHFTNPDFFDAFYRLIENYKINPQRIILEVTERELLDQNNLVFINQMNRLIQSGFSLAIDDYGTGHASITYIQNFPFNYLKIDRIFVQAIGSKAINESLIDAIITMGRQLNLQLIAEGVETSEQMDYLVEKGVRYLQGWYFAKALSIEDLLQLLIKRS